MEDQIKNRRAWFDLRAEIVLDLIEAIMEEITE